MKKVLVILILAAVCGGVFYVTVYKKEGPMEEMGRKMDEAVDKIRYGDESTTEKASRKLKDTAEDARKAMDSK